MCGIAGYCGTKTLCESTIETCLALMKRRGPDNQAWRHWRAPSGRNTYLLHSRLNIIDLDKRANQPLNVDTKWIAFNGEVYNYKELKADLIAQGRTFTTESDTEVLLCAIAHRGWDAMDQCEGMWAFAVYDEADGGVTFCRDRFGEKPLYMYRAADGIYFGSEIKFITCLLGRRPGINRDQLYRYLVNGYKSLHKQPETFFEGVTELPPGAILHVGRDGVERQSTYWRFRFDPDPSMTYDEAVERSRALLIDSVRLRLRSDVPIAFCMSGGVDSNALISVAKRTFGYDVHGFTIVDDDERYNETDLVNGTVAALGIRHTAIPVQTENFLPQLRALVRQHDAPVYTITYYAHWLLQRSIAEHGYKISVSGTGADELFTGYYDHHLLYLHAVKDDKALFKDALRNWETHVKPVVRNPLLQDPRAFIDNPGQREHIYLDADVFRQFLVKDWCEDFAEDVYTGDLMRNRMLNELFHEAVPQILHLDDLNAMSVSIENRSPFLDRRLFEFSLRVRNRHLIRNGMAKAVLRDALRGIAPDAVIDNRRKVGFNASIFSFLDVRDRNVVEALLDDSPIFDHVRKDRIEAMLEKEDLPNSQSKFLFYFICGKMFLEEFAS